VCDVAWSNDASGADAGCDEAWSNDASGADAGMGDHVSDASLRTS
jgi:hypothetical protein